MRKYIENLTDHLIRKNGYEDILERLDNNKEEFLKFVKLDLEAGDIKDMNPETLGKIMCSLETGDVMASGKELFEKVHFAGNCEEMLRELVALCLAYVIRDRLKLVPRPGIPPYDS